MAGSPGRTWTKEKTTTLTKNSSGTVASRRRATNWITRAQRLSSQTPLKRIMPSEMCSNPLTCSAHTFTSAS